MKINWVDILIVIYIVRAFFLGKKRGLSFEITALISALLAWVISLHFYQGLGESISRWFLLTLASSRAISFIGISMGILFLGAILGRFLKKVMKLSFIPNVEKIGGCILGILRGISVSAIIILSLSLIPKESLQKEVYTNSLLGDYLVAVSPKLHEWIWPNRKGEGKGFKVKEFWLQLTRKPKGEIL